MLSPIVYFSLINFEDLKKRSYLGKYLVPFIVPDVFMADPEMKTTNVEYKELMVEFKENHRVYEGVKQGASSPDELRTVGLGLNLGN